MSGERNEYMREYMREYRAAKKAARLAAGGESTPPSRAARYTEGQGQEETTEGGGGLGGWLWLGAIVLVVGIMCFAAWRNGTPEERADTLYKTSQALNQALNQGQDSQGQGGGGYYGYNPQ